MCLIQHQTARSSYWPSGGGNIITDRRMGLQQVSGTWTKTRSLREVGFNSHGWQPTSITLLQTQSKHPKASWMQIVPFLWPLLWHPDLIPYWSILSIWASQVCGETGSATWPTAFSSINKPKHVHWRGHSSIVKWYRHKTGSNRYQL